MDAHDGRQILSCAPPALFTHKDGRTTNNALHQVRYLRKVIKWDIYEAACATIANPSFNRGPLSSNSRGLPEYSYRLDHEHYLCGDEQSVCGRFAQNVLTPVTAVAFANNITTRFGDCKVAIESKAKKGFLPDFVAVNCTAINAEQFKNSDGNPELRFVGEAKTPWKHNLRKYYNDYFSPTSTEKEKNRLPHALGQIAEYMHQYQMKYGFLTTYDETIFIKQGPIPNKSDWGLFISPPVSFSAVPDKSKGYHVATLRQCMFYLMCVSRKEYTIKNPYKPEDWTHGRTQPDTSQYNTPFRDTSVELLTKLSRTPALASISPSLTDRIQVNKTSDEEKYTAILRFEKDDIYSRNGKLYAKIGGKEIRVEVKYHEPQPQNQSSDEDDSLVAFSKGLKPYDPSPRGQKSSSQAPVKPRVAFEERLRNKEGSHNTRPIHSSTSAEEESSTPSTIDTPTRGAAQRQGYGNPVSSSPQRRPVPPVGQHQSQSRGAPGVRETSPSPYAPYPTSQSPPRVLSQTRETTLPHRPPPPPGQYQSSSRDPSQIRVANPPNYPSMGSRQGGSPDRQAGRDDSGSKDKGKGKANTLPTNTKEYNLRSHVDKKGDSSKDKGSYRANNPTLEKEWIVDEVPKLPVSPGAKRYRPRPLWMNKALQHQGMAGKGKRIERPKKRPFIPEKFGLSSQEGTARLR